MALNVLNIFDFDLTLTKNHTFSTYCLDNWNKPFEECYKEGQRHAEGNLKKSCISAFKHDDIHELSAIASYHNNPHFIAGYVSKILKKNLLFQRCKLSQDPDVPQTAVNFYSVEGIEKPFLISYIPEKGDNFSRRMEDLCGKNEQILFLKTILQKKGYISDEVIINFYDDSSVNCRAAESLKNHNLRNLNIFKVDLGERAPLSLFSCLGGCGKGGPSSSGYTPGSHP